MLQAENRLPLTQQLLTIAPQNVPFGSRLKLLGSLLKSKREAEGRTESFTPWNARIVTIRRQNLIEDSLVAMRQADCTPFRVRFVDDFGLDELGIDGGGLLKEWMATLATELFSVHNGYFRATADSRVVPIPQFDCGHRREFSDDDVFELCGKLLGKVI